MADVIMTDAGKYVRPEYSDFPNPPSNVFVLSPYTIGAWDLRFDNPAILPENSKFDIIGVNIWRTTDSPDNTYAKLNSAPVQTLMYRDYTQEQLVEEDVSDAFTSFGTNALSEYIFKVSRTPVVKQGAGGIASGYVPLFGGAPTLDPSDVKVFVDGKEARVKRVEGSTGEITLFNTPVPDTTTQKLIQPVLPVAGSIVRVSYYTLSNLVVTALHQRTYYKVTSVDSSGRETPLDRVQPRSIAENNRQDWIWREAVRRNGWMLQQGGERVLLYIKKRLGEKCHVRDAETTARNKSGVKRCLTCYGTGIKGGYVGPIEIIISSPETAKEIDLSERGLRLKWVFETWTGPVPLINQRDFIIRKDGLRMLVGPVQPIYCDTSILQQEFSVESLDEGDIRYKVPVTIPQINGQPTMGSGFITDKLEIEDEREQRGRNIKFSNITY